MDNNEFEIAMKHVNSVMDNFEAPYKGQLRDVCEAIGYGRSMQLISEWWGLKLGNGGNFVVGTAKSQAVACGCNDGSKPFEHCDWCCGCGWLTEKVKGLKEETIKREWAEKRKKDFRP